MTQFILAIVISVAVLIFLIVKLKVHPVISLFIGGMLAGTILGDSPINTITTIANGFGSTLGSIGMTIIFGSIIACSIRDSGAAKSMVNFFIKLFRGKNLELSTGMAAYIMSIPVFGDVTMVLISPLCAIIGKRQNKPMGLMASMTILPLNLTHSMVPPTPGILAVSVLLGADLGMVILWGIVCSMIAYLLTWFLMRGWAAKDFYPPKPEYVEGVEEAKGNDYHDLLIKEPGLPNVLAAMSPILLPVILIALASFADMTMAEDAGLRVFLDTIGNRNIALFLGVICGWLLAVTHKEKSLATYNLTTGKKETSLFNMMFNGWVAEALEVALIPLIVTGFGGGFATIIKNAPAAAELGDVVAASHFPGFLVPFIIGAAMECAVGSRTTAGMTAAGLCLPMLSSLGITPVACAVMIGAGTMIVSHVNDSGWWVSMSMLNMDTTRTFKYNTLVGGVAGLFAGIAGSIFILLGVM
ncbi:GntP family permease [uncultured Oscillibacter sp.]|uniref:GntP family permease n=1 Tax=uncultured Oscillibacter sp. TaxID=876091 RepID=UPI0025FC1BD8|nr:GntP family permease [uncultured Oscillibacter sp.]